jgi:fatty-acid peroxygenase
MPLLASAAVASHGAHGTAFAIVMSVSSIPRDPCFDATLAARRDPYRYVSRRARELGTDVFETRLLLRSTLCLTGGEAARLFYDPRRFRRRGASPVALQKTLFGQGGIQGLDGVAHRERKALFLSLTPSARVDALAMETLREWCRAATRWSKKREPIDLYAEAQAVLTRAVCRWACVPLPDGEAAARTRDLVALFDAAGRFGPRHFAARLARHRSERWARAVVEGVRSGRIAADESSAAHRIAWHRDLTGNLLGGRIAAVELLNVLRPTIAVSVYVVFIAHALRTGADRRERLRHASRADRTAFVQEVRRFYPFFPAVPAIVRENFRWRGYTLRAGTRALLDLYGIDHDPRLWKDPDTFRPERFHGWNEDPYELVPQGGGDHAEGHRCAGEWITIALMETALRFLTDEIDYRVRRDDLAIDFSRLPALPQEPLVLEDVSVRSSS